MPATPAPMNGTIKINREGQVLWADDDAVKLLQLEQQHDNISQVLSLDGGKPLSEHLALTLEASNYSTRASWAVCHPHHCREASMQLSLWMDEENPDNLICLISRIQTRTSKKAPETQDLLGALTEIQKDYIANKGSFYVFGRALDALLQLTHSEYGFIGEILQKTDNKNYLKTHAITNIAWNEETRSFYQQNAPSGMVFENHDTLFGYTVKHGKQLISNNPANDPLSGGLPPGHPDLNTYLGIPIYSGEDFVGMAGIANRKGGYDEDLARSLAPFISTLGMLLSAYRNEEKRKYAEARLRIKAHQLEQANQAKTHFFATMSHELRTPLNSILGFSKRLHKSLTPHLNERDEQAFEAVIRNTKHLTALINDILDVSKMEAGKMEVLREPVRLYDIVAEGITAISGMAENHQVSVVNKVRSETKHLKISGDEKRLLQMVLNLISNAIKYGGGSDVHIDLIEQADNHITLLVEDFGPGLDRNIQQTLFQQYTSSSTVSKSHIESTGLGLALVTEIAKLHDGRIWVDSDIARGCRFYVAFELLERQ